MPTFHREHDLQQSAPLALEQLYATFQKRQSGTKRHPINKMGMLKAMRLKFVSDKNFNPRYCLATVLAIGFLSDSHAATRMASSISELQSFINSANSGDVILLADGTYLNNTISIGANNIMVAAATPGGVYLNGTNSITISGNSNKFSGFQFTSGSIAGIVINVRGNNNILSQLNFNGYSAQNYIVLQDGSQYNEISYSNFENKPTTAPAGDLIHVAAHASIPGYHKIRYSSFQNMLGAGGDNGNENIRLSNGAQSAYSSRTLVEFNYFSNTGKGDSEAISVKCRENVLRYNTFIKNPDAMLVFRNGNDNIAYGNFFVDAGGIRIKEANNIYAYNNYFERSGVGGKANAVTYDYVIGNLKNINFIHNTFVDTGLIDFSSGASGNTWANNIFLQHSSQIFTGSTTGISWVGNMYWGGSLGITVPTSGMNNIDPKLSLNAEGYFGLSSTSTAINSASTNIPSLIDIPNIDDDPALRFDTSVQFRDSRRDIGADEFVNGDTFARPLRLSDVGPSYLGGPMTTSSQLRPPAAPLLSLASRATSSITWNWTEDTSIVPVTSFDILRCKGTQCTPNTLIGSVSSGTRSYTDSNLARLTTYTYSVRAKNGSSGTFSLPISGSTK